MGFSLPAALGVKLAKPGQAVVALVGDGDFLMTGQELATAVQYNIPVVVIVLNNGGFLSIRDLQHDVYGEARRFATEFRSHSGEIVTPDFKELAKAFGVESTRVSNPGEVAPALAKALASNKIYLLEVMVNRNYPWSGGKATGWWDVPVPEYLKDIRSEYTRARSEEELGQ
jgi:acetolactate synthase-1/2/3 large subunit